LEIIFYAFNEGKSNVCKIKAHIKQASLSTLPVVRNNLNQTQADSAIAPNGLACIAYTEINGGTTTYKFCVVDTATGQNVLAPTVITSTSGTVTGFPRVFLIGYEFVVVFTATILAANHLQFLLLITIH
jgi:hypothetical protein